MAGGQPLKDWKHLGSRTTPAGSEADHSFPVFTPSTTDAVRILVTRSDSDADRPDPEWAALAVIPGGLL